MSGDALREQVAQAIDERIGSGVMTKGNGHVLADAAIGVVVGVVATQIERVPQHHGGTPISMAQYRADVLAVVERLRR